ncbi:histidine phosphatase family protein [Patescibacteria group bacterium]|nr:histidine phosphatase family protein [Patescibacteria group bacterium]
MNNTYFILRHGETPYQLQEEKILYPWPEPSPILLTKEGREQIKEVAKKLKKQKIDLIYASDMPRTRQTAEMVSRELGAEVIFDSRLWERNMGIYRGRPKEEYQRAFPIRKEKFSKPPAQGESWNDVKKRVLDFMRDIDEKHKGKNILIVSHGCPLWLLQGAIKGLDEDELLEQKPKLSLEIGELRKLCP